MLRSWELLIKIYKCLWKKCACCQEVHRIQDIVFNAWPRRRTRGQAAPRGDSNETMRWELSYSEWDCWGLCRFQLPICPNTCGQSPARARLGYLSDFMCQTVVRPNKLSFSVFCAWTRPFVFLVCPLTICAPLTQQDWSTSTSHLAALSLRYGLCTTPHASSTMRGVGA